MKTDRLAMMEQYIIQHEKVSTRQLLKQFDISINTLRSDLDQLEKHGMVNKIYGGAIARSPSALTPMPKRFEQNVQIKRRIGELAAQLIEDNSTIYIDSGSTTTNIIPALADRMGLTVVTNSLPAVNEAMRLNRINTVVPGGVYNASVGALVGMSAFELLRNMTMNVVVMGATGVSIKAGLTNTTYFEAEIKRLVTGKCSNIILLADHTKFDHDAMITYCPLERVSTVVTDIAPPPKFMEFFKKHGIQILYD